MAGTEPGVLVVDDEPEVGRYIAATLSRNGFRTFLAIGGRTALAQFRIRQSEIDLVLTDIVMADLSGPDLVRTLREIRPEVPVIYMTGYGFASAGRQGDDLNGGVLLRKPFTPAELVARIQDVLGKKASTLGASGS